MKIEVSFEKRVEKSRPIIVARITCIDPGVVETASFFDCNGPNIRDKSKSLFESWISKSFSNACEAKCWANDTIAIIRSQYNELLQNIWKLECPDNYTIELEDEWCRKRYSHRPRGRWEAVNKSLARVLWERRRIMKQTYCGICGRQRKDEKMIRLFGYAEGHVFHICLSCLEYAARQRRKSPAAAILTVVYGER
jgi:hypothetical protein